jgi:hypothetical protein
MKKLREILYVFLICVPFAIVVYIAAHIGILIYKLYKMTNPNDIKVIDPEVVSDDFSAVIRQLDINEAKRILKDAGYFVDNLWCVEDVQGNYDCTNEQAQEVLDGALQNEATMQQIWFAIKEEAMAMNLKSKEQ